MVTFEIIFDDESEGRRYIKEVLEALKTRFLKDIGKTLTYFTEEERGRFVIFVSAPDLPMIGIAISALKEEGYKYRGFARVKET
ncbi:TPA: hypothetical protein H1005_02365 [archaeon]|uniref:Uncharacterized protein n=1 Tax=Candidatus Naiadarchaeum limnaeum TaxID=2756139 RepID=A0A832V0J9_9ARCH|nr:hypothetical protein [Candidatus Naiadarchaeales archaeon SRR2090153.bin1042]HIK00664.1 hypothetical protein [Candidatus Naiadarchaeum limnaeum]